jgi:hypothetical protein
MELLFYTFTSLYGVRGSLLRLLIEDTCLLFHLTELPVEDDGSYDTNDKQKPCEPHHVPIGLKEPPYMLSRLRTHIG